jgi:hypothetical protein
MVYDVMAKSAVDGVGKVLIAMGDEPNEESDPQGWLAWRAACRDVTVVADHVEAGETE